MSKIKFNNIWFTSDTHFYHNNLLNFDIRPWKDIEQMNEDLITNINECVKPDDILIHLGDFVMGRKYQTVPKILPRINGIKYLILGNHDGGFKEKTIEKELAFVNLYKDNGIKRVLRNEWSLNNLLKQEGFLEEEIPYNITCCHFPFKRTPDHPDKEEVRYEAYYPEDDGYSILLHGHIHSNYQIVRDRMIHVGVDAWDFAPVNLVDLLSIIEVEF